MTKDYNPSKAHQDATKKSEPNPIEEAIGNRTKPKTPETPSLLRDAPEQPLTQNEAANLEILNQRTEERLQDQYPEESSPEVKTAILETQIPASQSDPLPVTKVSSPESPPQENDESLESVVTANQKQNEINESTLPSAEGKELTALKKYILEDGFVLATVAFHIVALCAQPMTTPSTTTWDFVDRAFIPDMVLALLNQPGYLEGIWPSLSVVMGSNKGNPAWCAGIATTIAFFDVIRTLPALKELKNAKV